MRVVRFIFHNWPLKLGAIALAVMLYGGMVILQNAGSWTRQVQITVQNQPAKSHLMDPLPYVTRIRYVAAADVPVTDSTFKAYVDLSSVQPSAGSQQLVKVQVTAADSRISVLDFEPQQVLINLEAVIERQVKVVPHYGTPPAGLTVGDPVATPPQLTVRGPESLVNRVDHLDASVSIEPSGLDVDQDVAPTPVDTNGNIVPGVEVDPPTTRIHVTIHSQLRTVSLPVNPIVTGSAAAGYVVSSVEVTPPVIDLSGEADVLASLKTADTQPISIAGATNDVTQQVALNLPGRVDAPGIKTVKVVVRLQALTSTRTIQIGVVPDGARPDRTYQLSATTVTVTIGGQVAALNIFDSSTLTATAAVGNLDPGTHNVKLNVVLPANLRLVSIQPGEITVNVVAPAPSPSPTPVPSPTASA